MAGIRGSHYEHYLHKYLLQDAQANGYAVPAFNIHNAETIQAILEVCSEMRSPVILAGTPGTFKHIALEEIYALCSAYSTTYNMPLALHLDHHESLDDIRRKVHAGVRSAMIDGSHFPFAENVKLVKSVVDFCHSRIAAWKQNWAASAVLKMT